MKDAGMLDYVKAEVVYKSAWGVPIVDAEEVVRCKDCKHWNGETHGCERHSSVEPWWETDFCNYGERKDEPPTYTIKAGEV